MPQPKAMFSPGLIIIIALISMVGPFSIDTYLPSFPAIEREFNINRELLLQSMGFYLVAAAFSTLIWGPLSDRYGRRRVIIVTLMLYMIASLGCALAENYTVFLASRIVQGIASSGGLVSGRAMIRDSHDSAMAQRAMSYVLMLFALAPAIAPIVGGWLDSLFGWRSIFIALALYGGIMLLFSVVYLRETLPGSARQSIHPIPVFTTYLSTFRHARFRAAVLTLGTSFAGLFIFIAGAPQIIYEILDMNSRQFAFQFIPLTLAIISGSFIAGRLSHRWNASSIITLALWVMCAAALLNLVLTHTVQPTAFSAILPFVGYAVGVAMLMPGITILSMDCFPTHRGSASAVQGFVQGLSAAAAASIIVPLLPEGLRGFAIGQALCIGSAMLFWRLAQRTAG